MITGRPLRWAALAVALVLVLLPLCSCADSAHDGSYTLPSVEFEETEPKIDKFIIVIPSGVSAQIYEAVSALCDMIEDNTGSQAEVLYDYESIKVGSDDKLIFVGNTDTPESKRFLKRFRADDYGYECEDGVVFVGGYSEEANLSAIERFCKDVVAYSDEELFMSESASLFVQGNYEIESLRLNGFELFDYSLIYPKKNEYARKIAVDMQERIRDTLGYYLEVKSDSEAEGSERGIRIGQADDTVVLEDNEAILGAYETGILLDAKSNYGLHHAAENFLNTLLNGERELVITESTIYSFGVENIVLMDIASNGGTLSAAEVVSISNSVIRSSPDIFRMEGISEQSAKAMTDNLTNKYKSLEVNKELGIYHFFSEERFDCSLKNIVSEGEIVALRYSFKENDMVFEWVEVCAGDESALSVAKTLNAAYDGERLFIVNIPFVASVDAEFSLALNVAERMSAGNAGDLGIYVAKDSVEINGYSEDNGSYTVELVLYK